MALDPPPIGSRIILIDTDKPDEPAINLTSDFVAAWQPDLSFDGKRMLFCARKHESEEPSIWDVDLASRRVRSVVAVADGCDQPCYLGTMYTMDRDAPEPLIAFRSLDSRFRVPALFTCGLDGSRVQQITFHPLGVTDAYPLSDGRLVCSVGISTGGSSGAFGQAADSALFSIFSDGADIFPFAALHEPHAWRRVACETSNRVVYLETSAAGANRVSRLLAVPRTRSLRSPRELTSDRVGFYASASALGDNLLMVAYRAGAVETYGLYVLDMRARTRVERVYDDPNWHEVEGVALRPRKAPRGRSTSVDPEGAQAETYGMNAYLSDRSEAERISLGAISRLRIIEALPARDLANALDHATDQANRREVLVRGREHVLGEIPVETDGSFFAEVPPRRPLRLETVDDRGQVLLAMQSWFWVMPQERRGCIGCHEDRELTPPNRHVLALRRPPSVLQSREVSTQDSSMGSSNE